MLSVHMPRRQNVAPKKSNWSGRLPRDPSTNCGKKAKKKSKERVLCGIRPHDKSLQCVGQNFSSKGMHAFQVLWIEPLQDHFLDSHICVLAQPFDHLGARTDDGI